MVCPSYLLQSCIYAVAGPLLCGLHRWPYPTADARSCAVGVVVVDGAVVVGVTELHIPNLEDNGPGLGKLFDLDLRLTYVGSVEP